MALTAGCKLFLNTGGSDNNGGAFDPTQTSGMLTDLAGTSADTASPVVSSASYTFVAGDVGHWVYIAAGTNWTPGWYVIASVAGGAATLSAAIGAATLATGVLNTAIGCATTASPSSGTFSIDYSRSTSAPFTASGNLSASGTTTLTAGSSVFTKAMVGNAIHITGGTLTAGWYVITAVASGTSCTLNAAQTTGNSSNGTIGGALASHGGAGVVMVAGNDVWVKYTGTDYASSSSSNNVSNGRFSAATGTASTPQRIRGYENVPGDQTANRPTIKWTASSGSNSLWTINAFTVVENLIFYGNGQTTARGVICTGTGPVTFRRCKFYGMNNSSCLTINTTGSPAILEDVEVTASSGVPGVLCNTTGTIVFHGCWIHDNSGIGISVTGSSPELAMRHCAVTGNTGGGIAFSGSAPYVAFDHITVKDNGADAVTFGGNAAKGQVYNSLFEGNTGYGFTASTAQIFVAFRNCAFNNNSSGSYNATYFTAPQNQINDITGGGAASALNADGTPNNNPSYGALLRAASFPGTLPGGTYVSYMDVGACQHQDSPPVIHRRRIMI